MSNIKEVLQSKAEDTHEKEASDLQHLEVNPDNASAPINNEMVTATSKEQQPPQIIPNLTINMENAKNRILELQDFIRYMMVPSIDYGFIPGCPKPMLFKSGAEKLCDIFGLSKQIEITQRFEDWDKGIFHYEVKAILKNKRTGQVEAEGIGSCNSREKKFASLNPFSAVNSILKMAKKRAIVDATLTATRTSGIFSQDLDHNVA